MPTGAARQDRLAMVLSLQVLGMRSHAHGRLTMIQRLHFVFVGFRITASMLVLALMPSSPAGAQCAAPTTMPDVDGLTTYASCLATAGQGCNFVVPEDSFDTCLIQQGIHACVPF